MTKIAIGIIDNHLQFYKQFALSLVGVVSSFNTWAKENGLDYTCDVMLAETGDVAVMRNAIAQQAIDGEYAYIFWMDSDQTFPNDCLIRLLSYCERDGREAASGLYTYRVPPFLPHIYSYFDEKSGQFHTAQDFPLHEPIKVEGAAFGCLLMRTSVFDRVEKPYFTARFENGKMVEGEDLPFCRKAKMNMVLDPDILCGHINCKAYGLLDYLNLNGIEIDKRGWVKPTGEQMDKIYEHHRGRK